MRGIKGKIIIYVLFCLLAIVSIAADRNYKITETLDPITALYVTLALSFAAGFVAGLTTLHIFSRLRMGGRVGTVIRHA